MLELGPLEASVSKNIQKLAILWTVMAQSHILVHCFFTKWCTICLSNFLQHIWRLSRRLLNPVCYLRA